VLNWGTIVTFLTLPLVVFSVQMYARTHPGWMTYENPEHFKYLGDFQRNLTILVFGLAGLRTWEAVKNGDGKHPREEHYEKRVIKTQQPPREEMTE
jgi:hypothetical protein